ncbi:MAG: DUF4178 domain-containing protein [Saprospiraceae bacterium]
MFAKKEIEIFETDHSLSIVLDWFSPVAYFLAFFCTIWCGFLVFWYSVVLVGGAPLIFALFPLLHVAVGVGLSYYTACLFKNKTYIDVDKDYLSVVHKPIPWWKGDQEISTTDIKQIYVKEKVSRNKNGTSVTYELRAKMTDGKDKSIFNLQSLESQQVTEIEERLELFMGITDQPVKGEFGGTSKATAAAVPRRQRKAFSDSPISYLYESTTQDVINLKSKYHKVTALTQYDWNDGNTDKFFQLLDDDNKEQIIYVEQNKAILRAFEETNIPVGKIGFSTFPTNDPPTEITLNGNTFYFAMTKKGNSFVSGVPSSTTATQWLFESEDQDQQIRFIDYDGQMTCYHGIKISESDFENTLDLNSPPVWEKEEQPLENRTWDEDDFV